jgi:hypothetical protein
VAPPPPVTITPITVALYANQSQQFTVTLNNGLPLEAGDTVTWSLALPSRF